MILFSTTLLSGQNDTASIPPEIINSLDTTPVFSVVENMPEFVGGEKAMYEFIAEELKYPSGEQQISGTVLVQFIVEKDGTITNAKVILPLYPSFDREVLRVINIMPKWKPGTDMGKPVRCYYLFPIKFSHE